MDWNQRRSNQWTLNSKAIKSIRDQYTLSDPSEPEKSRYFKVSKRNSAPIDTYLAEGQSILKIQRIDAGKDTQYAITRV